MTTRSRGTPPITERHARAWSDAELAAYLARAASIMEASAIRRWGRLAEALYEAARRVRERRSWPD